MVQLVNKTHLDIINPSVCICILQTKEAVYCTTEVHFVLKLTNGGEVTIM